MTCLKRGMSPRTGPVKRELSASQVKARFFREAATEKIRASAIMSSSRKGRFSRSSLPASTLPCSEW